MGCGGKEHGDDSHDHSSEVVEHHHEDEADKEHPVSADKSGDEHYHLHVSEQVIKQFEIRLSSPQIRNRIERIQLNGIVSVNQNSTFLINSLVAGIVVTIKKDLGDRVKRGDILCVLNSPELLELKTKYVKAYQEYLRSKEDYDRANTLFAIKAIEKKSLTNRETVYKMAAAEYFSLEATLSVICLNEKSFDRIKEALQKDEEDGLKTFLTPFHAIPSPGNGKVLNRSLSLGEMVENNRQIFEISDIRQIWVILDALERDLRYLKKGSMVEIQTEMYPGELFSGKILNIKEFLDPELRTVKIRVEVHNPDERLKPNMYVKALVEKKDMGKFPAVPLSAIVKISGSRGVFIKDGDGFAFKPVEVVDSDSAGYVYVIGLSMTQQVVVHGAFYLKAEFELKRGTSTDSHAGHQH
jgi:cobalt-zinc-cadmium efflux system membrane fusion protein